MHEQANSAVLATQVASLPSLSEVTMKFWDLLLNKAFPAAPPVVGPNSDVHDSGRGKW